MEDDGQQRVFFPAIKRIRKNVRTTSTEQMFNKVSCMFTFIV